MSVEDMLEGLRQSKIYFADAFLQIPQAESSKPIKKIHSPWELFCYNFLPLRLIKRLAGVFQTTIDDIIYGIDGVRAFHKTI